MRGTGGLALLAASLLLFSALPSSSAHEDGLATVLEWSTTAALGNAAIVVTLDSDSEVSCRLQWEMAGAVLGRPGPLNVDIVETEQVSGWSAFSTGDLAQAHVTGTLDTRGVLGGGGHWASLTSWGVNFDGRLRLTTAGAGLETWPESPDLGDWRPGLVSAAVHADCDGPVTVTSLEAGREVLLFNAESLDGGAGASAVFVGSAAVSDGASANLSAPKGAFRAGSFGYQAGVLDVETPTNEHSQLLSPLGPDLLHYEDGPGQWTVTLTRAGVYFEAFWGLLMGLHPVEDLSAIETLPTA